MTNSSSSCSSVPLDFNLSCASSLETPVKSSLNWNLCPLCFRSNKVFYCKSCINNGDFIHSTISSAERYGDKQIRLLQLKKEKSTIVERCEKKMAGRVQMGLLAGQIIETKEKIKLLRLIIKETHEKIGKRKEELHHLVDMNKQRAARLPRYEERVNKLESYAQQKHHEAVQTKENVEKVRVQLKQTIQTNVKQLFEYIFPINVIKPNRSLISNSQEDGSERETVSALLEATHTAYVRGRWVYTDCSGEWQHSIVAPTLPASGDYSAYNLWVSANKDGVPGSNTEAVDHNPAYNISAALTFTTQLVNVLAYFLDVRLPCKLSYSEFCTNELSEQKFTKRVARLNASVLHLCFSQNMKPEVLHPTRTLHNILNFLNAEVCDLGRQGPIEVDKGLANMLEDFLCSRLEELTDDIDESEDDSDHLPYEWENVGHIGHVDATVANNNMLTGPNTTSMAGGLVSSAAAGIASIFRGWGMTNR
ncbi:beclin 1-associated autophagy-related key regulator isoform X2 [Bemisia tabaci]|uniref:beclin 1-associated autophagy-related key regulator isoform X2 n=1 Tax=Bemisia tabaci TaxID=7038 RepID=UPI0008F9D9BD|nr:PREDICTED: beclin 1-associated autophagy-related key regulator isoform X2 [Bemisia tabaci]